jgi:hypothetical protein
MVGTEAAEGANNNQPRDGSDSDRNGVHGGRSGYGGSHGSGNGDGGNGGGADGCVATAVREIYIRKGWKQRSWWGRR